jgi:hypothetical protein
LASAAEDLGLELVAAEVVRAVLAEEPEAQVPAAQGVGPVDRAAVRAVEAAAPTQAASGRQERAEVAAPAQVVVGLEGVAVLVVAVVSVAVSAEVVAREVAVGLAVELAAARAAWVEALEAAPAPELAAQVVLAEAAAVPAPAEVPGGAPEVLAAVAQVLAAQVVVVAAPGAREGEAGDSGRSAPAKILLENG